jgi:hypothetical protein
MDKYVFGIVIRTETGMIFKECGSGALGESSLWMDAVYPVHKNQGEFFSMPESALQYVKELQKREGST